MLKNKHPDIQLVENKDNLGFSKANNQAIKISKGEYVLLLNPDTVVKEDTFEKVVQFMDDHPEAGGLGVRMIDGRGNFLPESKRGLPTPMVAFYKIFGISKLFPRSKKFAQYHAGHISENQTSEVDILSGAFMLMRKTALDKSGLLDEDFFMYGEDIDLSYRIQLSGFKNYYFSETEIIHYKGESTKKSSVNYVFVFYRAMVIFAKKHFSGNNAWLFSLLINCGIYLRAFMALFTRFVKGIFVPFIDLVYLVVGLFALTNYWKMSQIEFPAELIRYSIPSYAIVWLLSSYINGAYDRPIKIFKFIKGITLGTLLILIVYAILPKSLQFSRLFIFVGAAWALAYYMISRLFLHFAIGKKYKLTGDNKLRYQIVSTEDEFERIKDVLKQSNNKVKETVQINNIRDIQSESFNEIVFSSECCTYSDIINCMIENRDLQFDYKIAPIGANHLIGSNSIDTAGDLYIIDINNLVNAENKRKKRIFDITFSVGLLLSLPISVLLFQNKSKYVRNLIGILTGKRSFIGFSEQSVIKDVRLPKIKTGVLSPCDAIEECDSTLCDKLNLLYARDYSLRKDFSIVWKGWRHLDR